MDTSIGRGWEVGRGREGGRRQLCLRKAMPGADTLWPYRENGQGLCFPFADYRPAYSAEAAARSTHNTRGQRAGEGSSPKTTGREGTHTEF